MNRGVVEKCSGGSGGCGGHRGGGDAGRNSRGVTAVGEVTMRGESGDCALPLDILFGRVVTL